MRRHNQGRKVMQFGSIGMGKTGQPLPFNGLDSVRQKEGVAGGRR